MPHPRSGTRCRPCSASRKGCPWWPRQRRRRARLAPCTSTATTASSCRCWRAICCTRSPCAGHETDVCRSLCVCFLRGGMVFRAVQAGRGVWCCLSIDRGKRTIKSGTGGRGGARLCGQQGSCAGSKVRTPENMQEEEGYSRGTVMVAEGRAPAFISFNLGLDSVTWQPPQSEPRTCTAPKSAATASCSRRRSRP